MIMLLFALRKIARHAEASEKYCCCPVRWENENDNTTPQV
jgi:hypothetical protein